MRTYRDDILRLLDDIDEMPPGSAQIAACEKAVRLADENGDVPAAFATRRRLTYAAVFGRRPDVAFASFSWCLDQVDRNPQAFGETALLTEFKWILDQVADAPTISRDRIRGLVEDMERRYRRIGSTLHAFHQARRDVAVGLCDEAGAREAQRLMDGVNRDGLSNCEACVQHETVEYHLFLGDDEAALDAARPILDGAMMCREVPTLTYSIVLLPLTRLGYHDLARRCFKAGYPAISEDPVFLKYKAFILAYLTITGNIDRALRLIDRHLMEAIESENLSARFEFYAAVRLLLERITSGHAGLMVPVPPPLQEDRRSTLPATALMPWVDRELGGLARQFNGRNGNDGFTRRIQWYRGQLKHAVDAPLT